MHRRLMVNGVLALAMVLGTVSPSLAEYYHVEIADLEPGQPLTPPVAVVHGDGYRLFEVGAAATAGLEALAEDGMTGALVGEAQSSPAVSQVTVGGSAPTFASYKFLVEGNPGDLFSVASMFAKTNDVFVGVSAAALPGGDAPLVIETQAYDAGTEQNTGMMADIPAFGNEGIGPSEGGTVSVINSYTLQDDPGATGPVTFSWPPAARITITPMPGAVRYNIRVVGLSDGQPLTPPVIAIHSGDARVFTAGEAASPGLEMLAEDGHTAPLIAELIPTMGVWTAFVGGEAPGFEHVSSVIAQPGQRITITTMFARTNDVFTGVNSVELPVSGGSSTIDTVAWDAGTEQNTGMVAHIPLYGNAGGPDEGGVVMEINSYAVLDDPDGRLDYTWPPAATVTIETETSDVGYWSFYN